MTADIMVRGAFPGVDDLACVVGPIAGALAVTRQGAVCKTGL